MGYEEIQHTADWSLRVWADDFAGLVAEAARGMYALSGTQQAAGPRVRREVDIQGVDREALLVGFLTELLYLSEQEGLCFDQLTVQVRDPGLSAVMDGAPLLRQDKAIKAVTYHNLKIERTARGLETEIVFDV